MKFIGVQMANQDPRMPCAKLERPREKGHELAFFWIEVDSELHLDVEVSAFQQTIEPCLHEPLDCLFGGFLEHLAANRFRDIFVYTV